MDEYVTHGLNIRPKVFDSDFARYYICFNKRHYNCVKLVHVQAR